MAKNRQIDPDEIFLDSSNLPAFNVHHFEGRLERPIRKLAYYFLAGVFLLLLLIFLGRIADLQVNRGQVFAERSLNNTLRQIPIFSERGIIKDRNDRELAWNDTAGRRYATTTGLANLLGYIGYPTTEELASGKYHPKELIGRAGVEKAMNGNLEGARGIKIEEVNVSGKLISEHVLDEPKAGQPVALSIDAPLTSELYRAIEDLVSQGKFVAGAGVILDVKTGEILALTSVPEFDPNIMSAGDDVAKIKAYLNDPTLPFLDRAVRGLYTPGSIVKPVMALAALNEGVITPEKTIYSSGELRLPNPYQPGIYSVFKDWRAHGAVDVRRAIEVSSDVYFYEVGGGFENQKGVGIANINKYAELFGYGQKTGINLEGEEDGVVPSPEWKAKTFDNDPWRIGDTYHTVIGQYGFQVTPLQVARAIAAVATSGHLVTPTILKTASPPPSREITSVKPEWYQVVREGMRQSAERGTAVALNTSAVQVAGKTGTAELGAKKDHMNSWVTGFFPYESPRYAFAIVMERGPITNLIGAPYVMRQVLDWMAIYTPEYFKAEQH